MSGAGCACLKVVYNPEKLEDGLMRERWTCKLCGHEFKKWNTRTDPVKDGLIKDRQRLLECLIDLYTGVLDEPSQLKPVIEHFTGKKIEEVINEKI